MTNTNPNDGGSVASGIVRPVEPGPEIKHLEIFIGKWINEGYLVEGGKPGGAILTSDVYEWAPGGFFVIHNAYGRLAGADVGGIEIMGYDRPSAEYRSWFYDSQGNVTCDRLLRNDDGAWIWRGDTTRTTSIFSNGDKTQTAHHERLENGTWVPSMEVVLTRVG